MDGQLEQRIGYEFKDKSLLKQALTHASYTGNRNNSEDSLERLEFLGDAVLQLMISTYLFHQFSDKNEGELSCLRARLVCTETLAEIAKQLNLGTYIYLGKGEEKTQGRQKPSILADALEALIGALYLDAGFETCCRLIQKWFKFALLQNNIQNQVIQDDKTRLQEWSQKQWGLTPQYLTHQREGPAHAPQFTVSVLVGDHEVAQAVAGSKKEASKKAAALALKQLEKNSFLAQESRENLHE